MARTYQRKTNRGTTARAVYQRAMELVKLEKRSVRSVAADLGINRMTLRRFILKTENAGSRNAPVGYYGNRKVFSDLQETALAKYILNSSNIYFGLTPADVRKLAYECAHGSRLTCPNRGKVTTWPEKTGLTDL